jgi:hypothetical protein
MPNAHASFTPQDASTGAVLTNATVNVYNPGTVTPISATIFDRLGNVLSNPLTAGATTGLVDFYLAVAQEVDCVISKSGYSTRTISNVPVIDDASYDLTALLTTTGDLPYASSANSPARLPIGAIGTVLAVAGGVPAWTASPSIGGVVTSAGIISSSAVVIQAGGALVGGVAPVSGGAGQVGYSGTWSTTQTGAATSLPVLKGSGAGPATAAAQGWILLNVNGTAAYFPFWT